MRSKLLVLGAATAAIGLLAASIPVDAQERARTRITIQKRSYLDAGTVVKPGTARYHEYAFPVESRFPSYGPFSQGSIEGSRLPLLRPFEGASGF
ncbi:MAG: hypothetical protein IT539_17030 [Bradyrhizobiaceae bacterium]|nr:hypothetical protein [Bradyrhizobiaceae bacterium]